MSEQLNVLDDPVIAVRLLRCDEDELEEVSRQYEALKTTHEAVTMKFRETAKELVLVETHITRYVAALDGLISSLDPGGDLELVQTFAAFFSCEVPMCQDQEDPNDCTCLAMSHAQERVTAFKEHLSAHLNEVKNLALQLENLK